MKLIDIYNSIVDFGIKMDPRGKNKVKEEILNLKRHYEDLTKTEKEFFDKERLVNPYSDTRILFGKKDTEVKNILVGIDIEVGEVLLAERLRQRGSPIELLLTHHPEGTALAGFFNVMSMQIDMLEGIGVPVNIAESLMSERIKEVERRVGPVNHMRAVDAAKLLDIPFITCHTPSDNCVTRYLQGLIDKKKPRILGDILDVLKDIPEYKTSAEQNAPPKIVRGSMSNKAGKIVVDMTGGTEGAKNIFSRLTQAGVSTLVSMHIGEEHFKKAQEEHINVIVAGHIASDNIGINLMLDELEKKEKFNIVACSGFRRFSRKR